jgi:hypothetical protein
VTNAPPAAKPTIKRTGFVGYACARAIRDTAGSATAPAARCRNRRRGIFITLLLFMAAFGDSCRRRGHVLTARFDPTGRQIITA